MTLLLPARRLLLSPRRVLARDGFNRANALGLSRADTGQVWTAQGGVLQIVSNQCAWSSSGVDMANATIDVGRADVWIEAKVLFQANYSLELILRGTNLSNWYALGPTTIALELWKQEAGVYSQVANPAATFTLGQTYTIAARCLGNTIEGYQNGVKLFTYTNTFNRTATLFGVRMREVDGRGDNFIVRPA